ncbi:hypothetical protein P170DRAFT_480283 [Aspergillus steynii IBT 23096]|uniref:Uncharacterized protein n=1 Tax=Aspergillus steynii IBT 23096 TaxID=1392250 RepID=A0A2I2FVD2_9EURO|nr:uncharacterized protein P170DRAFT_480283 [Aspergillus steynii IBT 23096]PLB44526.1 hypothetical protein P170DRAFT_480283 [Aspergillus steynii IBT 23096]
MASGRNLIPTLITIQRQTFFLLLAIYFGLLRTADGRTSSRHPNDSLGEPTIGSTANRANTVIGLPSQPADFDPEIQPSPGRECRLTTAVEAAELVHWADPQAYACIRAQDSGSGSSTVAEIAIAAEMAVAWW